MFCLYIRETCGAMNVKMLMWNYSAVAKHYKLLREDTVLRYCDRNRSFVAGDSKTSSEPCVQREINGVCSLAYTTSRSSRYESLGLFNTFIWNTMPVSSNVNQRATYHQSANTVFRLLNSFSLSQQIESAHDHHTHLLRSVAALSEHNDTLSPTHNVLNWWRLNSNVVRPKTECPERLQMLPMLRSTQCRSHCNTAETAQTSAQSSREISPRTSSRTLWIGHRRQWTRLAMPIDSRQWCWQ